MVHWRHGSGASAASKGSAKHSMMMFASNLSAEVGWWREIFTPLFTPLSRGDSSAKLWLFSPKPNGRLFSPGNEKTCGRRRCLAAWSDEP